MLYKSLIGLAVVVVGLAIVVASQPADFKVSRSTTIAARPADVFAEVNDLHRMQVWNPWAKLDPAAKTTYSGPPSGEGAVHTWNSANDNVGEGKMTIIKSQPPALVQMQLDFVRPMASTCTTDFTFEPDGQGTRVTWAMSGKNNFIAKAFHLLMDCDKMVGQEFEKGLAELKSIVETAKK